MTANDRELLAQFARENCQDAFSEIVRRHVDLVYSAALRQVRSPQLAEEVAQSVFADLAREAATLRTDSVLTAWLYAVTRRAAVDVVRKESRRQAREQIALEMNRMNATDECWTQIEPLLDEAMATLDDTDRTAILLRYFENKSLREVGAALGTGDDAAQKRVSRAVDRLREFFSKRKVTIGASGLVVLISANAVQSAPVGLAVTIFTSALAGTAVATSTAIATTKVIAMTIVQKSLITATLIAIAGVGIYQARQSSMLRGRIKELEQHQARSAADATKAAALQNKVDQLVSQNADLSNALAQANAEKVRLEAEREQAKRGAALYRQLAEQASSKDANPTNEYPTPRHVWAAFGRFGRLAALEREDQSKLSLEEKSALDAEKLKALDELPTVVKAAKEYSDAKSMETDSTAGKVDMLACVLYGALNLNEQQFNQVYGLMQKYQQDYDQKGFSWTNAAPENVLAVNQMLEQMKTGVSGLLTPDQNRIFTDMMPLLHLEPGSTNSSNFNFNFSF